MSATLITTLIALAFFSLLLIVKFSIAMRRQRLLNDESNLPLSTAHPTRQISESRLLFDEKQSNPARKVAGLTTAKESEAERQELLTRALLGDVTALKAAANGDVYDQVLTNLVNFATYQHDVAEHSASDLGDLKERAPSEQFELMRGYASYVASHALRTNGFFVKRYIALWQRQPDKKTLAQMLYLAAAAGDVRVYRDAVEAAHTEWQKGNLPEVSVKDFLELCESHYWLLPAEVRASGDGFALKIALAELREGVSNERKT